MPRQYSRLKQLRRRGAAGVGFVDPLNPTTEWSVGDVVEKSQRLLQIGTIGLALAGLCGTILLFYTRRQYAWPFAGIMLGTWAAVQLWSLGGRGLPLLPLFLVQQAVINAVPLVVQNPTVENYNPQVLTTSVELILAMIATSCLGWWLGSIAIQPRPSRLDFFINQAGSGRERLLSLGIMLLFAATVFDLMGLTGIIWRLLPGGWATFYPVLRAFDGAASSLGAMLGGLALATRGKRSQPILFWLLFWIEFFLSMRDVLISAAATLVLGVLIGLGIGRRRIPWGFLVLVLAIVAFLNFGKFEMRGKYSAEEGAAAAPTLTKLPAFYLEWANDSLRLMGLKQVGANRVSVLEEKEKGQSMLMRLDNLQNLLFVVDALSSTGLPPLAGRTYSIIPALLIPRFLWEDKPRTHEGQVLLNLYYGRQENIEATEKTYVAWGLLPEAVGNFGLWWGALWFGLVSGFLCGVIEVWSIQKRLLSVEGFLCLALVMQLGNSFEMVASVLVTSTFQLAIAIITTGLVVRLWLEKSIAGAGRRYGSGAGGGRRSRKSETRRPKAEWDRPHESV